MKVKGSLCKIVEFERTGKGYVRVAMPNGAGIEHDCGEAIVDILEDIRHAVRKKILRLLTKPYIVWAV